MAPRLPPLPRNQLSAKQQEAHDRSVAILKPFSNEVFAYQNKDDALIGPYPALLAVPEMGMHFQDCVVGLVKDSPLSLDVRETAILAVGSVFKAAYELYAHSKVTIAMTQLSEDQVKQIAAGTRPEGLSDACSIAFDAARHLAGTPGPLPRDLWDRAEKVLGRDGTLAMVHFIGIYAYTCIVLNAIDAPVPEESAQ